MHTTPEIIITTPQLSTLSLQNASKATLDFDLKTLELNIRNGSKATLSGTGGHITAKIENASYLDAQYFVAQTAEVHISNGSDADVNVVKEITGTISNASRITQHGAGSLEKIEKSNGSKVEKSTKP